MECDLELCHSSSRARGSFLPYLKLSHANSIFRRFTQVFYSTNAVIKTLIKRDVYDLFYCIYFITPIVILTLKKAWRHKLYLDIYALRL